ncbi:hypothetical protein, variant [Exophiala dermatitidis NIH/UT8656]|uniref:Uncharacterized protein n=1 Tax=Exophiala dermatitidis (strain ATCC 34100 / CBS 525.76 / NIH/UT8656) TaxID=858893 RepID=H6C6C4_EXODN|nr:uncharacterized protein HMPREF1120_07263 [Exophiala dermatitidis NIH/UT8656]XP_009159732.1 hypothetical protein, variant [Exophiala dermatitidis NIH/UT8656]EHY59270.1 hypothetical protein, variant [Exophiala dermatitidis NIH/UT8656]EHY59271.1 hypothetical protein HMPREF1120_07263 [Exophiala dermatitidis NIH/UT8656]
MYSGPGKKSTHWSYPPPMIGEYAAASARARQRLTRADPDRGCVVTAIPAMAVSAGSMHTTVGCTVTLVLEIPCCAGGSCASLSAGVGSGIVAVVHLASLLWVGLDSVETTGKSSLTTTPTTSWSSSTASELLPGSDESVVGFGSAGSTDGAADVAEDTDAEREVCDGAPSDDAVVSE